MSEVSPASGLAGESTDFGHLHSLNNMIAVGVYLRLLADSEHQLASAWLGAHATWEAGEAPFGKSKRPVQVLRLNSISSESRRLLDRQVGLLRDLVQELSGDVLDDSPESGATVWVEVDQPVRPSAEEWKADLIDAMGRARLDAKDEATADLFRQVVEESTLGLTHRYGQRLFQFALADWSTERIVAAQEAVKWADGKFFEANEHPRLGRLNNWSVATTAPGPNQVSIAAMAATSAAPEALDVGLILPGGTKAASDVKSDLEGRSDIRLDVRIVPRGSNDLGQRMAEAVRDLSMRSDALVIAYGGGSHADLELVRKALRPPLENLVRPAWVAVGHAADRFEIDNKHVRMCRTPSDARALFLAEAVDYPRRLRALLTETIESLSREPGPQSVERAAKALRSRLGELNSQLNDQSGEHCQA